MDVATLIWGTIEAWAGGGLVASWVYRMLCSMALLPLMPTVAHNTKPPNPQETNTQRNTREPISWGTFITRGRDSLIPGFLFWQRLLQLLQRPPVWSFADLVFKKDLLRGFTNVSFGIINKSCTPLKEQTG